MIRKAEEIVRSEVPQVLWSVSTRTKLWGSDPALPLKFLYEKNFDGVQQ